MGPTQSALFRTFCHVRSKRSPNGLGVCSSSLLFPPPLLLLIFFLPSSAVFLGEQRGLGALAAPHSSTSLRLQITHFRPPLFDLKFGEGSQLDLHGVTCSPSPKDIEIHSFTTRPPRATWHSGAGHTPASQSKSSNPVLFYRKQQLIQYMSYVAQ
ncbi:hypothetical protein EYF80_000355 [Liparis tanakae]|uniref:Uncharacterized protein n=1 Tax=Liparis tanakae TaxID=230148 RepID=A0A4Z2JGI8_9TELE|nr:hypothetical protein EYF80_000355 [Liparis tanakae]